MALNLGPLNVLLNLKGVRRFNQDIEKATSSIDGVADSMKNLVRSFAIAGISKQAYEFAKSAATLQDATRIFQTSGGNLNELRKATQGLVDDFSLITKANLAKTMGIPAKEMGTLAKAAMAASKSTGESVDFMLDSIVRGVARGSPLILDNLGLIVSVEKANEDYARVLKKTADQLTESEKKQAFLNAAVEAAKPLIANAEKAGANAADAYTRFETSIKNIGSAIGTGMAPAVRAAISLLERLADVVSEIYSTPTTGALSQVGRERMSNAARQQEITRMLSTGGFKSSYPVGHPLAGMQVLPTMPLAQAPSADEIAAGRYSAISGKQQEQLQRELNRLRQREAELLKLENKEREDKGKDDKKRKTEEEIEKERKKIFDAAAQAYRFEIAPTDFDAAAEGLIGVMSRIGYTGAMLKDEFDDLMNSFGFANEMVIDHARGTVMLQEEFDEFMNSFGFASEIIIEHGKSIADATVDFVKSMAAGRIGATYGPEIGSMIGTAIGNAIAPGVGGPAGGMIGSVIGSIAGDAFDQLINALGVLTPIFELIGDIIGTLSAPLSVIGSIFGMLADSIGALVIPQLELFFGIIAKLLYPIGILIQAILPLVNIFGILISVLFGGLLPVFDLVASVFQFLGEQVLIPFAKVMIGAYNSVVDFINGITNWVRSIEIAGEKPFASFGVILGHLSTDVLTYAETIADENEAREEATVTLREFSEELRNVPIGVKRLRALQFNATRGSVAFPGRFNAPAFGA